MSHDAAAPPIRRALVTLATAAALGLTLGGPAGAEDMTASLTAAAERLASAEAGGWSENDISFTVEGGTVMATLARPEVEGAVPVVVMFHGFGGSRDELPVAGTEEGVFSRTARILAENGLASLRIDFRGSGESDGAWADTTFSSQIADGLAAVNFVRGLGRIDPNNVNILGWSQGGLVASAVSAGASDIVSTTLWAPVAAPAASYPRLIGMEAFETALSAEPDTPIDFELPWAEMTLNASFFNEVWTTDPVAFMAGFGGPLLVIVGTRDDIVWPQPQAGWVYLNHHEGEEGIVVLDTDHVFDAFSGPDTVDLMANMTAAWVLDHLAR
ncbi:MAG: alpha/beta fold hydrolase [Azospirillaceae bacterium]